MRAVDAITNLHTDDMGQARQFFGSLGLTEVEMNQGWVARFVSAESGAGVQVVTRDATAPEDSAMTIKVDDVDAAVLSHVDDVSVRASDEESPDSPGLIGNRVHDVVATSLRYLLCTGGSTVEASRY